MVDTVGNRTGPRATYVYTADNGIEYNIRLDESVSAAIGNPRSTVPTYPVLRASGEFPIAPRVFRVQLEADPKVTKSIVACNPDSLNWTGTGANRITINSQVYIITARLGERRFSLKVDEAVPPE